MHNFNEWLQLRESMSVYVQGYNFQDDVHDLYDLGDYLVKKIIYPIWGKLTPEQEKAIMAGGSSHHQMITADGSGNQLSFYTAGWPDPMVKNILAAIKYYLDEMGVQYGPIKGPERSGMFDSEVYRVPILKLDGPKDAPPQLNLSNDNARVIFGDVLQYSDHVLNGDEGFFDLDVRELLMRIGQVEKDQFQLHQRDPYSVTHPGKVQMHMGGLSAEGIEQRLTKLKQICQWAIAHHYDTIYVA